MDVPPQVQCSALMGLGLLYQGTAHRLMTEFLLKEIGRRCDNRDVYSLTAGLALGMLTLGRGGSRVDAGLADLGIEDRLLTYMNGGKDPAAPPPPLPDPTRSSTILEGDFVNVSVTSPGAVLALGLLYLRTNSAPVAHMLAPPDTLFLLDNVRPDVLVLRVMSRALVMWDAVAPSDA